MSPASRVRLAVELTDSEAMELAQFIKRVRFEQVAELTECGQSREQREEQAYRMLYALDQIGGALRQVGYAPR
jgi:hypothetical protein